MIMERTKTFTTNGSVWVIDAVRLRHGKVVHAAQAYIVLDHLDGGRVLARGMQQGDAYPRRDADRRP